MSDTKWTPAPWFISNPGTRSVTLYVEARIGGGMLQEIAACGPTNDQEQKFYNANLIAAAPDLYEALEKLRVWSLDNNIVPTEIVADVEYALAKARGE